MTVWYVMMFIMLVLFAFDYLENEHKLAVNELTIFMVLLMTALSGVRGEFGGDYLGYQYFFRIIPPLDKVLFAGSDFNPDKSLEPLYALLISTFRVFSRSYNALMFVQSFVLLLIVVKSLRLLRAPVNIGLILYFFLFYLSHFGQQRMAIVYVLCLWATAYVVRREPLKFLAVVLAATLIQYTAIFFLPAYALRYLLLSERRGAWLPKPALDPVLESAPSPPGPFRTYGGSTLNGGTLLKIAIGFGVVWFASLRLNIFQALYDQLAVMGGLAGNVYAYKFIAYYERIDPDLSVFNAWFGIAANLAILGFLYSFRRSWLESGVAAVFGMFAFGLMLLIGVYDFQWLGDRVFRMYSIGAVVGLFALIVAEKRGAWVSIPFVLTICVYEYLTHIATETELFVFADI